MTVMEVERITGASRLDAVGVAALVEAAHAAERSEMAVAAGDAPTAAETPPTLGLVIEAALPTAEHLTVPAATPHARAFDAVVVPELRHAALAAEAAVPPTARPHVERGAEIASLQTQVRVQPPVPEPARPVDPVLPVAQHAQSEFAVPPALAVPATLSSLQADAAWMWPAQRRGDDPRPQAAAPAQAGPAPAPEEVLAHDRGRDAAVQPEPDADADDREDAGDDAACDAAGREDTDAGAAAARVDGDAERDWIEPLCQALRRELAAPSRAPALQRAAEHWQRGRCVVLACPQGDDAEGPAWVYVLWPRVRSLQLSRRASFWRSAPLEWSGERLPARLHWAVLPTAGAPRRWCQVRAVKEHHPQRGRQLYALAEGESGMQAAARVPCELQLGPVLAAAPRWREVCVQVGAALRFWAALGSQWSVQVLVASRPLVEESTTAREEPSC